MTTTTAKLTAVIPKQLQKRKKKVKRKRKTLQLVSLPFEKLHKKYFKISSWPSVKFTLLL